MEIFWVNTFVDKFFFSEGAISLTNGAKEIITASQQRS